MKNLCILSLCILFGLQTFAQSETYDIVTFSVPKGWIKQSAKSSLSYVNVDEKKNSWCQITIYKSTISKGNIDADFDSEWSELVTKNIKITTGPQKAEIQEADGWKIMGGGGKGIFNNGETMVLHTVATGFNTCVSVIAKTNNANYIKQIVDFMTSIILQKPKNNSTVVQATTSPANNKFTFSTSNFDDGWNSTVKDDWVEVTKDNFKVLIHYPKEGTIFPADPDVLTNAAWDILVAPRYSSLKDYKTSYISDYERPYLGMGNVTDKATGAQMFVLLFKQGNSGWIEFIAPDKNSFIQQFKFDPTTIQYNSNTELLKPLAKMANYNRFAIGASDLNGKWTTNYSNNTHYVNIYTGNSAGMSTYTSAQEFEFFPAQKYKWRIVAANSFKGSTQVAQGKGDGNFKLINNWQIQFSNMEGKTKTFDAYFSCTKGGRIFWVNDANAPGSGIFTGFALSK